MKLTGILHDFTYTSNGRIYSKEVFDKAFGDYIRKENIKKRKEKLKKILENM